MQFDSYTYALFLPLVFLVYWGLRERLRLQNLFLLAASYVFYGWYLPEDFSGEEFDFDTKLAEDTTLYAGWTVSSVTVTFHNGSTDRKSVV